MANARPNIPAPPGRYYLPYQEKGIRFALGARGTLIADEMGLGKTVQAIGVINSIALKEVLIICPAGLKLNWQYELDDWLYPSDGKWIQVVSYHEARRYADHPGFDLVIVDEAHYVKNANAKRAILVKAITEKAKRVILLTGTPMENRPIELWPLLQIVAPEVWDPPNARIGVITAEQRKTHPGEGPNFWKFAKRYCDLKKTYYKVGRGRPRAAWDFSGASNLPELQSKLRTSCMVRRLKSQVLEQLPPKRRQIIVLPSQCDDSDLLPDLSEENYDDAVRQLTADSVSFAEYSKRRHEQALLKVGQAFEFISNALDESQKIIVFAHHQDVISSLAACFEGEGIEHRIVTGKTHPADRGEAVKSFQENPKVRIFLGSIGAAGVGITLTAASHVIFVELDPVPGRMTQAEDRAHRIGQKSSVLIQHLVSDNSLCARMAKILVKKQVVLTAALDTPKQLSFGQSQDL